MYPIVVVKSVVNVLNVRDVIRNKKIAIVPKIFAIRISVKPTNAKSSGVATESEHSEP